MGRLALVALVVAIAASTTAAEAQAEPAPDAGGRSQSAADTLAYWQQDGKTAEVNARWVCLVGSYHHTCITWVNGAGLQVNCPEPGCDPIAAQAKAEAQAQASRALAYWQQPGRIAAVDAEWRCIANAPHHTCTAWEHIATSAQVTCDTPGCDPSESPELPSNIELWREVRRERVEHWELPGRAQYVHTRWSCLEGVTDRCNLWERKADGERLSCPEHGCNPTVIKATAYVVQEGDTLGTIARDFCISFQEINWASDLDNPNRLQAGQEINIPEDAPDDCTPGTRPPYERGYAD